MSKNIEQVYVANPITTNASTDLMYFGQSPYGAGNDAAMTYANFSAQFGAPYTAAALTKTDDTNVTLTLGGSPSTALLHAASLTLGWTGQLSLTRGGTNTSLTASNGGIVYSTATAMAILAGTATANLPLLSGATGAPTWGAFALSLGGALTTAGALTTSGAFGVTFTFTNTTSVTFPVSGTLATTSQIPSGAALTKGDDTNVTLTLGGSPSTALVNAASITAGWTGTLAPARGGTGVSNTGTFTIGGNTAFIGAFTFDGTLTNNTAVTFPTSGTLATTTQLPTPAALTKADDTNVTLTLGGTPATALLQATSITAGWTGTLSGTRGGTGVNNGASTITLGGSLVTSGAFASTFTMTNTTSVTFPTSGTLATTTQIPTGAALTKTDDTNVTLTLGGSPTTALVNAASITAGWTGTLSGTRGGTGVNNGSSTITIGGNVTYSGAFTFTGTVTGNTSVTFPTSGTLATTAQLTGLTWNDVSGTTQAAAVNNGYIISNASQTTVTIPATAAEGSVFAVQGKGAAGWILQMNTGQTCHLGSSVTSSAGTLTSTNLWDAIEIICVTANTVFATRSAVGNITIA
jgi:hypothetical protein